MEPKEIYCDRGKLPSLSARYQWFIAQNLEAHTQIFYTLGNKHNYYHCRIHELRGRRIRACFHGWVILSNHPDNVLWSLWNPLTSKLIRLPPLIHEENRSHQCCLSAPPDDQASVLLLTSTKVATIVFCRLDRKRKKLKWTEMSYAKQLKNISGVDHDCFLQSPTCYNGKVYAMASLHYYHFVIHLDIVVKGNEVVISLSPFVEIPYRLISFNRCPTDNTWGYASCDFLKGSCSELFYIKVGFTIETKKKILGVHLFTLDKTSMKWEKIVDLKNVMFFLELASDYTTCYCSSVVDSELAGYVHILSESGKIIYSFHTKDRTMSISSMPCAVLESQASTWAMLEWRFEIDTAESKQEEEEDKDTQMVIVRRDNISFDGKIGESRLLNIPIHILELIMEHIGIEYMRLRATCKHCWLITPRIQWNYKTTTLKKRLQMYPWFMVLDNYRGIITFIDPICGERYFLKTPQELKGDYHIYCCKYGWLLMYNFDPEGPQLVFFNPLTSDIIHLPEVPPYLESFCFSAPPTSLDCMVVGFTTFGESHVFIHFVSKESKWHCFTLDFDGNDPYSFQFPTFNGRADVYAVRNNGGVEAFRDLTEVDYAWDVVVDEAPRSRCRSPTRYFLSSCDQHLLLLVIVGEFGDSVEVFKLNESTEEWQRTYSIGKHMIYISDTSCICLDAKSQEMENKIYFPRLLHNEDTKMVFYSLETCRYHTFDDKNIQQADLLGTKHHCNPHTWIEPSWS